MNEREVKDRVLQLFKANRISVRAMAQKIGMAQKNLNNQVSGEVSLSMHTLLLILSTFPNVSAEWLLRGTGDMFLDGSSAGESKGNEVQSSTTERVAGGVPSTETYIADLQRQIAELRKDKELLGGLLQQLTGARK